MAGYFADDSMAVRVMSKRAVGFTYGLRALVVGAANPRLYVGTSNHTEHRATPYNRLAITGRLFEAVFLGTKDEADRALEFTRRKHAKVVGVLDEPAGTHCPAGTPYSALDPHLMYMTMAFTFDSVEAMHDLLVRPLRPAEREALWQDFVSWGELFGMPRSAAPASYRQFRSSFDAYLDSDELFLTDEAKLVGAYLSGSKRPGLPVQPWPAQQVLSLVVQGSLPPRIRHMYGLRWTPVHEAAFRSAVRAVRSAHARPLHGLPAPLRPLLHGTSSVGYQQAARLERNHLRHGRPSMPGVSPVSPLVRR
ncbi:oxygenase MpaB family protein [Skermania sp. ID1734]|uniref:oxygenase MpaB family protein n=1 Tax=Skermania sp. ID1734 TaxID=2597516 RepID=UPI00210643C2|nr:oxygenase MpaB family protein [Skermania sp. ID1734]